MKKTLLLAATCIAAAFATVTPAAAQRSAYEMGNYWDVGMIDVEDGQFEAYMDWINTEWKKQQSWMKSKGYITDYYILSNGYKRGTEPDLYLITVYPELLTPAKEKKMQDEFIAMMGRDEHKLDTESGARTKMRTVMGGMLLRQLTLAK
jgi:hypothetical protein